MKKPLVTLLSATTLATAPVFAAPMTGGMSGTMTGGTSGTMSGGMSGMMGDMMMDMTVESEFEFLAGMVPHHRQAADDARLALERSERPEVQTLAQEIIDAQEAEIAQMETWLSEWYPEGNQEVVVTEMDQAMMGMNMPELESLSGDAFDRAFLEGMIMHHQMAIHMVDALLTQDLVEHEEVRALAEEIRSTQEAEISEMQSYLQAWFSETATGAQHSH